MGIIIGKEFTKYDKDVEIETIGGRELISSQDIIGVDGDRFTSSNLNIEKIYEFFVYDFFTFESSAKSIATSLYSFILSPSALHQSLNPLETCNGL